jgi:uncharacterized protein (TIGR03435 family)
MLTEIQNVCNSDEFNMVEDAGITGGATGNLAVRGRRHHSGGREPRRVNLPGAHRSLQRSKNKLGLKVEPTKGTGEFLFIDHVERPSEN